MFNLKHIWIYVKELAFESRREIKFVVVFIIHQTTAWGPFSFELTRGGLGIILHFAAFAVWATMLLEDQGAISSDERPLPPADDKKAA